jgi:hypothetical protein
MSTQKHYRRCLERLAADPPKRRVALIRTLLPEIEAAVTSGQNLKDIWEALQSEGLEVGYHTFYMVVWRARKKPTAARGGGKQDKCHELQGLQEPKVETDDRRDPFANLRRLEENRPGFHWRARRDLNSMVHGTEVPTDKKNR